ncbi:MAG: VanZ family protein [Nitrospiraceae bacterium]
MVTFLRYWGPVCGYAGLIFYLSSQPLSEEDLPSFFGLFSDKILHGIEYAVLGGICYRAFRWGTDGSWRDWAVPLAILLPSLYGVSDEVHQAFVPFRDSDWHDWLADTLGATIGTVGTRQMLSLWPAHSTPEVPHRR